MTYREIGEATNSFCSEEDLIDYLMTLNANNRIIDEYDEDYDPNDPDDERWYYRYNNDYNYQSELKKAFDNLYSELEKANLLNNKNDENKYNILEEEIRKIGKIIFPWEGYSILELMDRYAVYIIKQTIEFPKKISYDSIEIYDSKFNNKNGITLIRKHRINGNFRRLIKWGIIREINDGGSKLYELTEKSEELDYSDDEIKLFTLLDSLAIINAELKINEAIIGFKDEKKEEKYTQKNINYNSGNFNVQLSTKDNRIKCPMCKSVNVEKISTLNRMFSVGFFGLSSSKIGKTMQCKSCGYKW